MYNPWLVGGFNDFLCSSLFWGRWPHFDKHIFQMGWFNHQPVVCGLFFVSIENPRRNFRLNLGSQEPRGGRFGHRSLSAEEAGETNCANALKGMVCRPKSTHPKTNIASSRRPSQKEITSSNPSDSGAGLVSGSVHPWKSKHHYKIGFHRRPFVWNMEF